MTTIFALSSGRAPTGVAVVRISGPQAHAACVALAGTLPSPRHVVLRNLKHENVVLDRALVCVFAKPESATGEDVVEFHLHGGRAVIAAVLEALSVQPGLRAAEPGEFTRRSFLNGKLDLAQVEGLADLIDARTEAQRVQALDQMSGRLSALYEAWRKSLIHILALIEVDIDFADGEDDVPEGIGKTIAPQIEVLRHDIISHLADGKRGERLRDGLTLAILGPPNVGKSSFINMLSKRDAAIVSPIAGTTRDVIEVELDLGGYPVTVIDTAGLRDTQDAVELEGIRRARARAASADIVLNFSDTVVQDAPGLWVRNKIDCDTELKPGFHTGAWHISLVSGAGVSALIEHLKAWARDAVQPGEAPALTRVRHRAGLQKSVEHLRAAQTQDDLVLCAEELRLAARALGALTGRIDVEDLLDVIFRDFCIGK
jgi:tRNA modification GTPase